MDFLEILRLLQKSVQQLQNKVEIGQNTRHYTWIPKNVGTLDSSMKYFVALQKCKSKPLFNYHDNIEQLYIAVSYL